MVDEQKTKLNDLEVTKIEETRKESGIPHLCASTGPRKNQAMPIVGDTFFIGRSRNNTLVLQDRSVSRKHVVINNVEGEYVISDLNSRTGLYVNGKKLHEATLHEDDVIGIGESLFTFQFQSVNYSVWQRKKRLVGWSTFFMILVLGFVFAISTVTKKWKTEPVPLSSKEEDQVKIYYDRGVEFYNANRDLDAALKEWKKAADLDPQGLNIYSVKAKSLLEKYGRTNLDQK
ncbi:FHA domain-containing protein [bacterium]|nr:FHA domain-containing protein [bacterium]